MGDGKEIESVKKFVCDGKEISGINRRCALGEMMERWEKKKGSLPTQNKKRNKKQTTNKNRKT